jgi:two-component system response regulator HydG
MRQLSQFNGSVPLSTGVRALPSALVGDSDAARGALEAFVTAMAKITPALIVAERGCRTAQIAQALHAATRPSGSFVAIDCGATEPSAVTAQLYGAPLETAGSEDLERLGMGAALAAEGATVFLDNVAELPASAQRRLARILRDGEVRVGAARDAVPLSCRVIAASATDLDAEVRDGRFRHDLLRRLQATTMTIAPLRQRPADLAALIDHLVAEAGVRPRAFTRPALTVLAALPWTDNIDELAATVAKVLASAGDTVRQEDVLPHLPIDGAFARLDLTASLRDARRRFEREYIAAVLERHHWRMSDAARTLGMERANLYRKTRQLGIARSPRAEVS